MNNIKPDKIFAASIGNIVDFGDLSEANMTEISTSNTISLESEPNEADVPDKPHKFSLDFEVKVDEETSRRWHWEHLCHVAPWVKRNFVKETITHRNEYNDRRVA